MTDEAFFYRAAKAIREKGTYSKYGDAWTIGVPHLQKIFEDLRGNDMRAAPLSHTAILEEGERRGFWEVNYDHDYVADLVVIRPCIGG